MLAEQLCGNPGTIKAFSRLGQQSLKLIPGVKRPGETNTSVTPTFLWGSGDAKPTQNVGFRVNGMIRRLIIMIR